MNGKRSRHKACNACNLRKVRCNGEQRCQQCEHLNLACEYAASAVRQVKPRSTSKKNPATPRAVREVAAAPQLTHQRDQSRHVPYQEANGNYTHAFFAAFLSDFQTFVLPFHPVITVYEAQDAISSMDHDCEARAFVYGLVAVTLNLTHSLHGRANREDSDIGTWVSRTLQTLQPVLHQDDISVRRVATLQFVHVCLMGLGRHELAFYYLRSSTTMVEILRVGDADYMAKLSSTERCRRGRLYWMVFVHERFYAITCQRPVVLPPLSTMLERDPNISPAVTDGFNHIARLFMHIDQDMLSKWFGTFHGGTVIEPAWIIDKHRQLDAETAGSAEEIAELSSMQQADLVITKHWLKMLIWQISMSEGLLSSAPSSEQSMSLLFPVSVSGQLRTLITNMSKDDIEVHGSGLQQKLFELTDTIASVVLTVPASSIEEKRQRVEDFGFLYRFWRELPRPDPVQGEILEGKYRRLAEIDL